MNSCVVYEDFLSVPATQPYIVLEDGTIVRAVGKARPWSTYQCTDAGRPEPQ